MKRFIRRHKAGTLRTALALPLALITTPMLQAAPLADESEETIFDFSLAELTNLTVTTPSKLPRSLAQSPGIVSVFTAQDIARFGAQDFGDVLAKIPGLQSFNDVAGGKYRISVRADSPHINNNHILFLLNGIPFNRDSYLGGLWTPTMVTSIPLNIIKQVEVVKGPGSALYGTNAYAGVINIITKDSSEAQNKVSIGLGNNSAESADLDLATHTNGLDIVSSFRFYQTDGSKVSSTVLNDEDNDNVYDDYEISPHEKSPAGIFTLNYKGFRVNAYYGLADLGNLKGSHLAVGEGKTKNEKYFLDVGYTHGLNHIWEVKADISHVGGRTELHDSFISPTAPFEYETDDSRLEIQLQGSISESFTSILGVTADYFSGSIPFPGTLIDDWDTTLYGLYGQAEYLIRETRLIAGAQYNKAENIDGKWVPRLAVIQNFTDSFGGKLQYGQAFRAPYPGETDLHAVTPVIKLTGNPDLDYELVTTWDLQFFYNTRQNQTSLTLFQNKQKDLINREVIALPTDTSPTEFSFKNSGELTIQGLELEFKHIVSSEWYILGSFLKQRNKNINRTEDTTLQPDLSVKLGIAYQQPRWTVGLFDNYLSAYQDNIVITPTRVELNPESEPVHLITLNFTWEPSPEHNIKLELNIDNLLDEDIYLPPTTGFTTSNFNTYPSVDSGRSVMTKATWQF